MNGEIVIYAFALLLVIWLVAWRLGARPGRWREAIAGVFLYIALSLGLIASGVAPTESITIAVIGSALLVAAWKRFGPRRSEGSV